MCSSILGYNTFVRGLNRYLSAQYANTKFYEYLAFLKHIIFFWSSYGNTNEADLWNALGTQASLEGVGLPATFNVIMNPWTQKMGYPYITVTRNYQTGSATATQVSKRTIWINILRFHLKGILHFISNAFCRVKATTRLIQPFISGGSLWLTQLILIVPRALRGSLK